MKIGILPLAYHLGQQHQFRERKRLNVACMGRHFRITGRPGANLYDPNGEAEWPRLEGVKRLWNVAK